MEGKQHAPSVIARLMGLGELPPQQPIHRQRRVLSESYLQKTASVGLWEKSSFSVDRVPSINLEDSRASKDVLGVKEQDSFNVQTSASYCSAGRSALCKSAIASTYRSNGVCKGSHESGSSRGLVQQHDKNHFSKPRFHFELKPNLHNPSTRIVLLRSSSKTIQNPESNVEPSRQSFRVPVGTPKQTIQHVKHAVINNSEVTSGQAGAVVKPCMQPSKALSPSSSGYSNITVVLDHTSDSNGSFFSKEAKNQIFEQWKMTKNFQEVEVARRSRTLGEMLATADLETQPGYLDSKNEKHNSFISFSLQSDRQGSEYPLGISSKDGWKDEVIRASPRSKVFSICSTVSGNPKSKITTETSQYRCLLQEEGNARDKDDNKFRKHNKNYYVEFEGEREMILEKRNMCKFSKHSSGLSYSPSKGLASTRNGVLASMNNENTESSCMIYKGLQSEPTLCSSSRDDDHSFGIQNVAVRQVCLFCLRYLTVLLCLSLDSFASLSENEICFTMALFSGFHVVEIFHANLCSMKKLRLKGCCILHPNGCVYMIKEQFSI